MSRRRRSYVRPVEIAVPYALVAVALVVSWITVPRFLSTGHLTSMSITAAYLGIIAIGQTLVILLGGIDLSVPYTVNFAAILLVQLQESGYSASSDFIIVMLFGICVGLVNGVGVAVFDISPLVMTLGMNGILQGAALVYSKGNPLGALPEFVTTLSTGLTGGWPNVVFLWMALTVVVTLVLVFTRFGRNLYSVGANRRASELSGLPVRGRSSRPTPSAGSAQPSLACCSQATRARPTSAWGTPISFRRSQSSSSAGRRSSAARVRMCRQSPESSCLP